MWRWRKLICGEIAKDVSAGEDLERCFVHVPAPRRPHLQAVPQL